MFLKLCITAWYPLGENIDNHHFKSEWAENNVLSQFLDVD